MDTPPLTAVNFYASFDAINKKEGAGTSIRDAEGFVA